MEEENKEEMSTINFKQELIEQVENKIQEILNVNIEQGNVDYLGKLVDIHKDIKNEEYWKEKEGIYKMRYYDENLYGNYGRKMRDSQGRYAENSYGRRGVPGTGRDRYSGDDVLEAMEEAYCTYMESGSYGTQDSMQKIEIMADSLMDFVEYLRENAKTPEERQLIERKIKELGRM